MKSVDWSVVSAADVLAFADTVARVARELARTVPAPRGAPLFGLDMTIADPELLDPFSRHGIFRKYQRALALGSGLVSTFPGTSRMCRVSPAFAEGM